MARRTKLLDSRRKVPITSSCLSVCTALGLSTATAKRYHTDSGGLSSRAIVPIGLFFSLSLICGNLAYLYLSVSFIQMLKVLLPRNIWSGDVADLLQATNAVATLLTTWAFGIEPPNLKKLGNVSFIVVGVVVASFGEIKFVLTGFICMQH